jgi:hypothetical protein
MSDSYLLIDYVYLDSEERKRFAQSTHEYLIEQLQFTGSESLGTGSSTKVRLNFNHPCKFLVWVPHLDRHATRTAWVAHADNGDWNAARDRVAKVIALAALPTVTVNTSSGVLTTSLGAQPTVGDLIDPTPDSVNSVLNAMRPKVEVKFVAGTSTGSGPYTVQVVNLGGTATVAAICAEALNNAIVVRNDLTMEDISNTLATLKSGAAAGPSAVLDGFAVSVVNHFNYGNFVDGSDNPVYSAKLQLNGHDRFQSRDGSYFNYVQPWQHFSNTPADGVNVYSFALKPEEHQPSGTCNFSRIDNAMLNMDLGKYNAKDDAYSTTYLGSSGSIVNIYTMNYNVLRVMSGMAGTAYSN